MEQFGPGGNFPVKVVHLQRWSSLTGRSRLTRNYCSIFRNFRFQSCSSSSLHTVIKMADGSDVSVYECSVCKLQKQDLSFLLLHSCTQGSATAEHLYLFFLLVFISFFKNIILSDYGRCFPAFFPFYPTINYPTLNLVGVLSNN